MTELVAGQPHSDAEVEVTLNGPMSSGISSISQTGWEKSFRSNRRWRCVVAANQP